MSDTIREQIIQKFITRGAAILTAGGKYQTNIGANVQRVRSEIDPEECPALVVWPLAETNERKYGKDGITMQVRIEGFIAHGTSNTSTIAEKILGDLRKCFGDPAGKTATFGSLVEDVHYASGGNETYAKAGELITGCNAIFTVRYKTLAGNPYSQ